MVLKNTVGSVTWTMPEPALHTFSSERRVAFAEPGKPFYEEATYWNSQWGTPMGANETTTIDDLATTAISFGTGSLLSKSSYAEMTDSKLIGFGKKEPACEPSCFTQIPIYNYGLGTIRSGPWMMQNPLLSGIAVTTAHLPSERISISVRSPSDRAGSTPRATTRTARTTSSGRSAPADRPAVEHVSPGGFAIPLRATPCPRAPHQPGDPDDDHRARRPVRGRRPAGGSP